MMIPYELKQLYQSGRLIVFVGAGASMAVSWEQDGEQRTGMSWREFVDLAAKQLGFGDPGLLRARGTDLQILEYYKLYFGGFTRLTNAFLDYMKPDDNAISKSKLHRALSDLTQCSLFYTTNFDNILERSFRIFGRDCNVIAEEADMAVGSSGCDIVKFHGDLEHPDRMVLSESQYELRMSLEDDIDYRFKADLLNRSVLFIGYSFRDANVAYLLRLFLDQFESLRDIPGAKRAYIVVHNPTKFERTLYADRHIGVITLETMNLTEGYAELLNELGA